MFLCVCARAPACVHQCACVRVCVRVWCVCVWWVGVVWCGVCVWCMYLCGDRVFGVSVWCVCGVCVVCVFVVCVCVSMCPRNGTKSRKRKRTWSMMRPFTRQVNISCSDLLKTSDLLVLLLTLTSDEFSVHIIRLPPCVT